jgi:hypothetical protein
MFMMHATRCSREGLGVSSLGAIVGLGVSSLGAIVGLGVSSLGAIVGLGVKGLGAISGLGVKGLVGAIVGLGVTGLGAISGLGVKGLGGMGGMGVKGAIGGLCAGAVGITDAAPASLVNTQQGLAVGCAVKRSGGRGVSAVGRSVGRSVQMGGGGVWAVGCISATVAALHTRGGSGMVVWGAQSGCGPFIGNKTFQQRQSRCAQCSASLLLLI